MKILLLGKSGMLGSCFLGRLEVDPQFDLSAFDRSDLDILDFGRLREVLVENSPAFVVNCAAYTAVDDCEEQRDLAFSINGLAVGELAKICREIGAVLLHFSTDYVFDGQKAAGYLENDLPSPINVYGESKLAGERLIAENMTDYYIIRTSWLFGPNGRNFVDTMLRLAETRDVLDVVDDQVGAPTFTEDLCDAVIENFIGKKPGFGVYHLTNSGTCSWNAFAKKIFEIRGLDVDVNKVGSEAFPRPAKRPNYSILINSKVDELRSWEEALFEYLK